MTTEVPMNIRELAEFIRKYSVATETELDRVGRNHFPYHQDPCLSVTVYEASDGIAAFYMPGKPASGESGIYGFDYSAYTLNQIIQTLHKNMLQWKVPVIGATYKPIQGPLEHTESIPGLNVNHFSDEVREVFLNHKNGKLNVSGYIATPLFHVDEGVITKVYPCRVKLWSPTVEYPAIGRTRYFFWNHADIWWHPETLSLPDPHQLAQMDVFAARIMQCITHTTPADQFGKDTDESAAEKLERDVAEFLELLDGRPQELAIHNWLVKHDYFLEAHARRVLSKVPFGSHVSDFVVEHTDGTYELIEIEDIQRIFTASGSEPCARFNHACTQVRDWMRYINENLRTVSSEQNLSGIYQPKGRVIMGRSNDIDTEEAKQRWRHLKSETLAVDTYDDLIARVKKLAETLRLVLRGK